MHVGKNEEPDSHDYGSKDACNTRAKAIHKITASGSENAGLELFDGKPKRDGRQAPSKGVPYVFDEDRETYLEDTKTKEPVYRASRYDIPAVKDSGVTPRRRSA